MRASSGLSPSSCRRSISSWRWLSISSVKSSSDRLRRNIDLPARGAGVEDQPDGPGQPLPLAGFPGEMFPPRGGQIVEARAPVVRRHAPRSFDPLVFFEPLQRRIEGTMLDQEFVAGTLLDRARDPLPMFGPEDQGPENQQVERALQEIKGFVAVAARHLIRRVATSWVRCQPKSASFPYCTHLAISASQVEPPTLGRDSQELVNVAPHDLLKHVVRRRTLQDRQRLACDALASEPRGCRIIRLADAGPVTVRAAAVAPEEQLVLMALQEVGGELR